MTDTQPKTPRQRSGKITTEGFVEAARRVHGSRYDYATVHYQRSSVPVTIVCKVHGPFQQTPNGHLSGKGCSKCAQAEAGDRYRKSTANFIEDARSVHGERYDYSHAQYLGANKKVVVVCSVHGEFAQSPSAHLQGQGCPDCGREKLAQAQRWTMAQFVQAAHNKFGTQFGYQLVEYADAWTLVRIVCPEHGEFKQAPISHLVSKYGCPKCAIESTHAAVRMTTEVFIERARARHGDRYRYDQANVIDSKAKVTILCPKHGSFRQAPSSHLAGQGCSKCGDESTAERLRQPLSDFIERARAVHGDKYVYNMVEYISARRRVRICCPEHGDFEQTPDTHLRSGCRKCADNALPGAYSNKRFDADTNLSAVRGTLYYVKFTAEDGETFYKVGISSTAATKRFAGYGGSYGYRLQVLASIELPLAEAYRIEQTILDSFGRAQAYRPKRLSRTGRRFGGRTECFDSPLPASLVQLISNGGLRAQPVDQDAETGSA